MKSLFAQTKSGGALVLALGMTLGSAQATVISQNTGGTFSSGGSGFALGQSVTTSADAGWDHITFNLVSSTGSAYANGSLYLLTQAYTGTPAALSSATTGFLASTSAINAGAWVFDGAVALAANTQYFLYMDTLFDGSVQVLANTSSYPGGSAWQSNGSNSSFTSISSLDLLFSLNGTDLDGTVPEPGSLALAGLALLAAWAVRRPARP